MDLALSHAWSSLDDKLQMIPSLSSITPQAVRRRFTIDGRVRSGCLTCKARKKKCDEQYTSPDKQCKSCTRLGLVCERRPLRAVLVPRNRRLGKSGRVNGKGEECYDVATTQPDGSCAWTPAFESNPIVPFKNGGIDSATEVLSTASSAPSPAFPLEHSTPERVLLRFYLERLAPLSSILQDSSCNEFRNVLVPMAMDDSSLLYAVYAYSACHLPFSKPVGSVTAWTRLRYESQAARALRSAIHQNTISESSLACALISSTAEATSGDTRRWTVHLQGAGDIIDHLGGPTALRRSNDGCFLLRNFAYHDIMASLSTGRRPRYSGLYWLEDEYSAPLDSLMGVSHEIFGHMSAICHFISDHADTELSPCEDNNEIIHRGESLAQLLRLQTLSHCVDIGGNNPELLLHHAESYRHGALLRLYHFLDRLTDGRVSYAKPMSECVQTILAHISQIPYSLCCEVGTLFPLFMVGVSGISDNNTIEYITSRLRCIESWTNFKHISRAREILEVLWAGGESDWQALLRQLNWHISLA